MGQGHDTRKSSAADSDANRAADGGAQVADFGSNADMQDAVRGATPWEQFLEESQLSNPDGARVFELLMAMGTKRFMYLIDDRTWDDWIRSVCSQDQYGEVIARFGQEVRAERQRRSDAAFNDMNVTAALHKARDEYSSRLLERLSEELAEASSKAASDENQTPPDRIEVELPADQVQNIEVGDELGRMMGIGSHKVRFEFGQSFEVFRVQEFSPGRLWTSITGGLTTYPRAAVVDPFDTTNYISWNEGGRTGKVTARHFGGDFVQGLPAELNWFDSSL